MCGINGIFHHGINNLTGLTENLKMMNKCIIHRGPDDDGIFSIQKENYSLVIGMRRLSIIDIEMGKQPLFSANRSKVIVFNGEIFNYIKLRDSLKKDGVAFETSSDTEVVLKLYEKYGEASFSKLDGMFAFSIYDSDLDSLFIVRDYFGEKPLYFTRDGKNFSWASELKSLVKIKEQKPRISKEGLNLYFQLTYIPAPHSIYEDIYKLEANSYIKFDCKKFTHTTKFIEQNFKKLSVNGKQAIVKLNHDLVQESVLSRSISDVPLGTFLSGGVDSSIISLCLAQQSSKKIDTFSIGFEKKSFDETVKSREVAKLIGSNHHEFIIGEKDLSEDLDKILLNFDEPFADSSALASYVVSQKTSEYVKVALTGDGGDEVYGGYNKYYMAKLNQSYIKLVPNALHNTVVNLARHILSTKADNRGKRFKINRLLNAIDYEGGFYYGIISLGFQEKELKFLLDDEWLEPAGFQGYKDSIATNNKTLTDFRNIDKILSLEGDMLVKVDRTSMMNSLECRAPLLNKEIWNFTQQLPESYLMKGWDKKYLLKESFKKYFPKDFLDKPKKGFGVPVGDWLRTTLRGELKRYSEREFIERQGIFDYSYINDIINNHLDNKRDNTFKVWTFYCFQKWYFNNNHGI